MVGPDFESRAFRRRILVGLWSFIVAFAGLLGLAAYLILRFVLPERGWLDSIVWFIHCLVWVFVGAMLAAAGAIQLVEWPYLLRGKYRCPRCGRKSRRLVEICPCMPGEFRVKHSSRFWPHVRRQVGPVLLTYVVIIAIVVLNIARWPGARHYPLVLDVMIGHAALAALVGALVQLAIELLEMMGRARRFRLRATVYVRALVAWPLCLFVIMAVLTWLGLA
jgi:hypothetical protein